MRILLLMRGVPGSGKSTFIKQHNLEPYTLSADALRLLYSAPQMNSVGNLCINQRFDKFVWPWIMQILKERMQQGCFTVIDATNIRSRDMNMYKKLANKYKYRIYAVDFTDIALEEVKKRNLQREDYKQVSEKVIDRMYAQLAANKVPSGITVIKPDDLNQIWYNPCDLSNYKKVIHIGDIHGCYKVLKEYLQEIRPENYYIFLGDYIDRGSESAKVLELLIKLAKLENVTLIEGNHERSLMDYGLDDSTGSKEFRLQTAKELREAGLSRRNVYDLYRKFAQCFCYTYNGKKILASHGGLARMPENLSLVSTEELIYGTGEYEDVLAVDMSFAKNAAINEYQVHGHRNYEGIPTQVNEHCFNLDGAVEMGGQLRVVELSKDGFSVVELGNPLPHVSKEQSNNAYQHNKVETVQQLLESFANNPYIKEKSFGDISSFNFTRAAFYNKAWDDITCKARGLYINKHTEKIVARSYDKFFNLNERPETKLNALKDNLQFPVQAYVKVNGFLGIVGYDIAQQKLLITSKGDMNGLYAKIFRNTLAAELKERMQILENFVKEHNCSVIFECIEPFKDPHIIEYNKPTVVLLEIIENELAFVPRPYLELVDLANKLQVEEKKHACTLENWQELHSWLQLIMQDDYLYDGKHIEGFVIEDSKHFMTKLKLAYYSKWKKLRQISEATLRYGAISAKWKLNDELSLTFYRWLKENIYPHKNKDGEYPFATDIISLRKLFEKQKRG